MGREAPQPAPRRVVLIPYPIWLQSEYQPAIAICNCGHHPRVLTLKQLFRIWDTKRKPR